jgi:hypothetical protein
MSLASIAEWLEGTAVGVLVRETVWGFPIVVAIHILGLTLSVGMVIWFDLRLLGVTLRNCCVSTLYRRIIPWAGTGFALMFVSGGMLLVGYATAAYGNMYFRIKAVALVLAGVNAFVYHALTERTISRWDDAARLPLPARVAGLTSILLWMLVILAGRMMSYTMFSGPN